MQGQKGSSRGQELVKTAIAKEEDRGVGRRLEYLQSSEAPDGSPPLASLGVACDQRRRTSGRASDNRLRDHSDDVGRSVHVCSRRPDGRTLPTPEVKAAGVSQGARLWKGHSESSFRARSAVGTRLLAPSRCTEDSSDSARVLCGGCRLFIAGW